MLNMLFPNLLLIPALASFAVGQNILSTVTSQVTSTELVCNTIMTDKSAEAPLPTITTSTTTQTQPPVRVTSTNAPSTFTLTLSAIQETSTLIETITETFTGSAGMDVFSTTFLQFTTTTDIIPVHATTTEIATFITTQTTTVATSHVPTSIGYLPIGSTFLNRGVYGNSLPVPAKRDLLPRVNITIITGDKETIFDEADCICDSDRNIFPASVECTQVLTVYLHEDVYIEDAAPLTTTLSAATSTIVSTVTVIATSTLTPSNIPTTFAVTSTSSITETTYTTHFDTETSTTTSTLMVSATQTIFAACATGGMNYLGPRFPPKNQQLWFFESESQIFGNARVIEAVSSSVDCCGLCHMDPLCAGTLYSTSQVACAVISSNGTTEVGIANQILMPMAIITTRNENWGKPIIMSNGNNGYWWGMSDDYTPGMVEKVR